MPKLNQIIKEETNHGRKVVQFLVAAMEGDFPDFQPCHKLQAVRLLEKYGFGSVETSGRAPLPSPTKRERREAHNADRRINTEFAKIVREKTDNGRKPISFLVKVMEGELDGFKPCHRMSASKELLRRCEQAEAQEAAAEAQAATEAQAQVEAQEQAEQDRITAEEEARRKEQERQREEDIHYSKHGPVYYETYPWPCVCEDRKHDCKGNELSGERLERVRTQSPALDIFYQHDDPYTLAELADLKTGYREYLVRRNARYPDNPIHYDRIRWLGNHDP